MDICYIHLSCRTYTTFARAAGVKVCHQCASANRGLPPSPNSTTVGAFTRTPDFHEIQSKRASFQNQSARKLNLTAASTGHGRPLHDRSQMDEKSWAAFVRPLADAILKGDLSNQNVTHASGATVISIEPVQEVRLLPMYPAGCRFLVGDVLPPESLSQLVGYVEKKVSLVLNTPYCILQKDPDTKAEIEFPHCLLHDHNVQPKAHCDSMADDLVSAVLHLADQSATWYGQDLGSLSTLYRDCKTNSDVSKVASHVVDLFDAAQLDVLATGHKPGMVKSGTLDIFPSSQIHAARPSQGTNCTTTGLHCRAVVYFPLVPYTRHAVAQKSLLYSTETPLGFAGSSKIPKQLSGLIKLDAGLSLRLGATGHKRKEETKEDNEATGVSLRSSNRGKGKKEPPVKVEHFDVDGITIDDDEAADEVKRLNVRGPAYILGKKIERSRVKSNFTEATFLTRRKDSFKFHKGVRVNLDSVSLNLVIVRVGTLTVMEKKQEREYPVAVVKEEATRASDFLSFCPILFAKTSTTQPAVDIDQEVGLEAAVDAFVSGNHPYPRAPRIDGRFRASTKKTVGSAESKLADATPPKEKGRQATKPRGKKTKGRGKQEDKSSSESEEEPPPKRGQKKGERSRPDSQLKGVFFN